MAARLEVGRDDGPLVRAGAEERLALVALDVEVELVALDLGQAAGDDDGLAGRGRREVSDANLVSDRGVPGRQQAFYRTMAGPLHQPDHGRRGEDALAADVASQQA